MSQQRRTGWSGEAQGLEALDAEARARLDRLTPVSVPRGTALFHPGESAKGFVVVLDGRIEVFLTGPSGRDILLYAVEPGGSCVQTTLGLLGGEDYSGEAVTTTDSRLVLIPKPDFLALMDQSPAFRGFVFSAFAKRMQNMMHVLERVAFQRVESRLAQALLDRAAGDAVQATHQELATAIGSAREVVSRRLESFVRSGWVTTERGVVRILDAPALHRLAAVAD
ncbi:Crp/Fnr family transcriptional regulator [Ostreiculturibacter nitratireducens]|uniref:Crp/Fnr family transcriptional regulator n=1 Tax=Ostreiculturibacter nitratireducens TaxID=3075226 RepID=UPI0031B5FA2E